jgi:hypothetical protein
VDTPTSLGESPTSPPSSTKKRFWSSFRNKTSKKFRRKHKSNEVFMESLSPSDVGVSTVLRSIELLAFLSGVLLSIKSTIETS